MKYKKKIKGFVLPFNTRVKYDNTEAAKVAKNYKPKKPKNIEKIKEEVRKITDARKKQL